MSKGHPRDPHKEQFWRSQVKRWQASGLSVRDYCARYQLSEPSFYAWRRLLAQRDADSRDTPMAPAVTFVPLHVATAADDHPATLEVVLGNGRLLRVPAGFDAATLRTLLAVLEDAPC